MFDYHHMDIPERIDWSRNALTNALTPAYLDRLTPTYTAASLQAGLDVVEAAGQAHRGQDREYGEQFTATDELTEKRADTYETYMLHAGMARVAFAGQRGILEDLGLDGPRERDLAGWLDQAENFYTSALAHPELEATFTQFQMPPEVLEQGATDVAAIRKAKQAQLTETAEAQGATDTQTDALGVMDVFMPRFIKVSRLVFKDDPQMLEGLGIPAR